MCCGQRGTFRSPFSPALWVLESSSCFRLIRKHRGQLNHLTSWMAIHLYVHVTLCWSLRGKLKYFYMCVCMSLPEVGMLPCLMILLSYPQTLPITEQCVSHTQTAECSILRNLLSAHLQMADNCLSEAWYFWDSLENPMKALVFRKNCPDRFNAPIAAILNP